MNAKQLLLQVLLFFPLQSMAQIGLHRSDLSIGLNGGYVLSSVGFNPKVDQSQHGGFTGGLSVKYVCEKYFNTFCSLYAEVNYASIGWKQDIKDLDGRAVINTHTGEAESYLRTINYVQVPIFAHLAWGKEDRGAQFFFQLGPQMGLYLSEKTQTNYEATQRNLADRANKVVEQESMPVERKFDYGIAAGLGVEYRLPSVGHFLLEARYYYGLGSIYGESKRDFFGRSNFGNILLKMAYLFDVAKTQR